MSKAKGARTRRKCEEFLRDRGYLVDRVELGGRFTTNKDLFSEVCDGFDIVAIKPEEFWLVQCKTNTPATQKTYKKFAKKYANDVVKVVVMTWYDRKGFLIQHYNSDGTIKREDLRK